MATKIIPKKSSVAAKVPLDTDLDVGEIAINLADQKLYSKNASGNVVEIGGGAADQTPTEILTAIKTVDGSSSGLDADLLDGQHASDFATAAQGTLADSAIQPNDNADLGNLSLTGTISGSTTFFDVANTNNGRVRLLTADTVAVEAAYDDSGTSYANLYFAGSKKLETTNTGIEVTGDARVTNSVAIGSASAGDFVFTYDGASNTLLISQFGTNLMRLDSNGNLDVKGNINTNATL